jgi:hemerythrin-like metal-binding protein
MSVLTLPASFRVGVEPLDADHSRLFAGMNALHDAVVAQERPRAAALIRDIGRLAGTHFEREEAMLVAHRYPLLRHQSAGHEAVFERLRAIAMRIAEPDWRGLADTIEGLVMLKLEGVMVADMDYRWWFEARGIVPMLPPAEPAALPLRVVNA